MAVDEKYGQLYTEADIEQLINALDDAQTEGQLGPDADVKSVVREHLGSIEEQIPHDEPVFILRAQDKFSVDSIENYLQICGANNCMPAHLSSVMNAEARFRRWQSEHPDTVKLPD